jgi:hypothetical protein
MASVTVSTSRISLINPLVPAAEAHAADPLDPSPPTRDERWDHVLDELQRFRSLEDDWDGQGACALEPANVDATVAWVKQMRGWERALPPTAAVPGVTGEVILEWRGETYYLAAEICDPSRVEWLLSLPGQPVKQWNTDSSATWYVRTEH